MPIIYAHDTESAQDITGSGVVLATHSMSGGRVGATVYLSNLNINSSTITVVLEPLDYQDFSFGAISEVTIKQTGATRHWIEVDRTVFVPEGSKIRVTVKSNGTSNTSVDIAWYLFDPNHASDVAAIGGEALGTHAGDNLNTFFQNGGATSTKTLADVSNADAIADAVWEEPFGDHTSTVDSTAEHLAFVYGEVYGVLPKVDAILDDTGTTGVKLASSHDLYHADINVAVDAGNNQDEYTVTWFKNGARVTATIGSPDITVIDRALGDPLFDEALTEISGTGILKKDITGTLITPGNAYVAIASATIDSATRTFSKVIGRDAVV